MVGRSPFSSFILGVGIGCLVVCLLVVNNLRDVVEDRITGKRTLVVRFGETWGRIQYIFCLLGAWFSFFYLTKDTQWMLRVICLTILVLIIVWLSSRILTYTAGKLNRLLPSTSLLMMVYTLLFSICVIT